jgi:cytochrome P450
MAAPGSIEEIDLADPDLYVRGDPDAAWRLLRASAPVHWGAQKDALGFWSITKHRDAQRVYKDAKTFSSEAGVTLATNHSRSSPRAGKMLLQTDPPRHTRLRQLLASGFTPRMVARLEQSVREIVRELVQKVRLAGRCDFAVDFASRLPLQIICEMMGCPREDWDHLSDLANTLFGADDPEYQIKGSRAETGNHARDALYGYYAKLIEGRRKSPGDDLVSVLTQVELEGKRLTDEEILVNSLLFITAGNETTVNATVGGMLALIEHADERRKLLANPTLLPSAIEEILRWVSPLMHNMRRATCDVELGGQTIRAGDAVVVWNASANRDEEVFVDPTRFDITRSPNNHIAFGYGAHFCIGASLARLELRVMYEELLPLLPGVELVGEVQRLRSNFVRGIKHLPVQFGP